MRLRNRFPGWCQDCGHHVPPGLGFLLGKAAFGRWRVRCESCEAEAEGPAPEPPPRPKADPFDYEFDWIIRQRIAELQRQRLGPPGLRVLGLAPPVTAEAIRSRYRELAMRHHPDHGGDPGEFIRIKAAVDEALEWAGGRP
jgi:hypothetical protein